jgi:hypothetical protein
MGLILKFLHLPGSEMLLFVKALAISLFVKIVVLMFPLRWYSKYLVSNGCHREMLRGDEETIKRITRAIHRCSRYSPWPTRCLVDAITAKILLRQKGIGSTLYLGVNKDKRDSLIAHAWLTCGERFITGRKGHQKFVVVSSFA